MHTWCHGMHISRQNRSVLSAVQGVTSHLGLAEHKSESNWILSDSEGPGEAVSRKSHLLFKRASCFLGAELRKECNRALNKPKHRETTD